MTTKVNAATAVAVLSILALIAGYILGLVNQIDNNPFTCSALVIIFAGVGCNTWEHSNKKRFATIIAVTCVTVALIFLEKMFFGFEI